MWLETYPRVFSLACPVASGEQQAPQAHSLQRGVPVPQKGDAPSDSQAPKVDVDRIAAQDYRETQDLLQACRCKEL